MNEGSLYDVLQPTSWASAPRVYSYSSLATIKDCPRRWLLVNSIWGDFAHFPVRVVPSAIEGQIVHEALDRLAKELGRFGRPPIGSSAFCRAVEACGFWTYFAEQLAEWNSKLAQNQRPGQTQVLRTAATDLANSAICLFREQYRAGDGNPIATSRVVQTRGSLPLPLSSLLKQRGSLTEQRLTHPSLPIVGVLDLVQLGEDDRIIIVDFKTGRPTSEHEEQLETYAVLW